MHEDALNRDFAAARKARPAVSDALMARVLADAAAHQPAPARAPARGGGTLRGGGALRGLWARIWTAAGGADGFGAGAGLAAATLAGVWIGFAQPGPAEGLGLVPPRTYEAESFDLVELIPDFDRFIPGADEMEG